MNLNENIFENFKFNNKEINTDEYILPLKEIIITLFHYHLMMYHMIIQRHIVTL
jgi:hypothetical protein